MTTRQPDDTVRSRAGWTHKVAVAAGVFFTVFGLWAFAAPQSFFDAIATYEPYNRHFSHDLGAFQLGLGAVLLLAAWRPGHGLATTLAGAGFGSAFHAVAHVLDRDLGGRPAIDIPGLVAIAVVLAVAGWAAWPHGPWP